MTDQGLWNHEDEQDLREFEKQIERGEMTVRNETWEKELAWIKSLK